MELASRATDGFAVSARWALTGRIAVLI
jgi:hypothetical protein